MSDFTDDTDSGSSFGDTAEVSCTATFGEDDVTFGDIMYTFGGCRVGGFGDDTDSGASFTDDTDSGSSFSDDTGPSTNFTDE